MCLFGGDALGSSSVNSLEMYETTVMSVSLLSGSVIENIQGYAKKISIESGE
jgi:hypothetical protein